MIGVPSALGGPLGDALAAAGAGASQRLQELAAPANDARAKAAELGDQAAQAGDGAAALAGTATPAASAATASALDQIASTFSPVQSAATPGSPCGCGDHIPAAFDRATAEQALVDGLDAAAQDNPLRQAYEDRVAALSDYAGQLPAGTPADALGGLVAQAAQARHALAQSYLGALPAPLRDALGSGSSLLGEDPVRTALDRSRSIAAAAAAGASPAQAASDAVRQQVVSAIGQATDDAVRQAASLLPK